MKTPPSPSPIYDPYAAIAAFYDLQHDDFTDDIDCLLNFVIATGDPVLELGCGSGRMLTPIAEAGFHVTGIDSSAVMLDRARARIAGTEIEGSISLIEAPMSQAAEIPGGPFGVVLLGLNSLLHLESAAEQRQVLSSAFQALDPRGLLLLDVFNPTPQLLSGYDLSYVHEGSWELPTGEQVQKFSSRRVSPSRQTIDTEIWYDTIGIDGSMRRTTSSFGMRYTPFGELELMLELAGFASWIAYGSYDLDPYDDHSERLIIAAEAS